MAVVILLLLALVLASCAPQLIPSPVAVPAGSRTTAATLTPSATASPSPGLTTTRRPTATATPQPTVIPTITPPPVLLETFPGARMKGRVSFSQGWQADWFLSDPKSGQATADEVFKLFGQDGADTRLVRNTQYVDGQGLVFDFRFNKGTVCQFSLENGEPATYDYRQFSVYSCASSYISLTSGETRVGLRFIGGNMALQPDTWYSLALGVAGNGEFTLRVWEKPDPRRYLQYQERLGVKWNSLSWRFSAQVDGAERVVEMKEYYEFTASETSD
jgi:hypothetical protein